jgi:hypothetical protein
MVRVHSGLPFSVAAQLDRLLRRPDVGTSGYRDHFRSKVIELRNSSICSYRFSPIRAILAVTRSPRLCYSGGLE